jgi:methionyl-tRNA formyltransferase
MPALRLVMMGTGSFAEPTFEALLAGPHPVVGLVTQPDRAGGQERSSTRLTGNHLKTLAEDRGVSIYHPESINTPEGVETLQRVFQPDLLVVAAYGQILSREVLAVAPRGGINVHASLLPKYRGAAPIAWAIYNGETRTGVSIIRMTTGLDAGDVLAQQAVEIGLEETAGELEARLAPLGAQLALQVVAQLAAGMDQGVKQDKAQATKAPKLKKEDGLIDWTRRAEQVCNQIRAMQPWPTAYTFFHREGKHPIRLLITKATARHAAERESEAQAGECLEQPRLAVRAGGQTVVEILALQPAGKRRMSAIEFLRGHPLQRGDHFGPEQE